MSALNIAKLGNTQSTVSNSNSTTKGGSSMQKVSAATYAGLASNLKGNQGNSNTIVLCKSQSIRFLIAAVWADVVKAKVIQALNDKLVAFVSNLHSEYADAQGVDAKLANTVEQLFAVADNFSKEFNSAIDGFIALNEAAKQAFANVNVFATKDNATVVPLNNLAMILNNAINFFNKLSWAVSCAISGVTSDNFTVDTASVLVIDNKVNVINSYLKDLAEGYKRKVIDFTAKGATQTQDKQLLCLLRAQIRYVILATKITDIFRDVFVFGTSTYGKQNHTCYFNNTNLLLQDVLTKGGVVQSTIHGYTAFNAEAQSDNAKGKELAKDSLAYADLITHNATAQGLYGMLKLLADFVFDDDAIQAYEQKFNLTSSESSAIKVELSELFFKFFRTISDNSKQVTFNSCGYFTVAYGLGSTASTYVNAQTAAKLAYDISSQGLTGSGIKIVFEKLIADKLKDIQSISLRGMDTSYRTEEETKILMFFKQVLENKGNYSAMPQQATPAVLEGEAALSELL